jgi:lipopolysaccharide assembly protein A
MNKLTWLLKWVLKAAIFFTLFAFALNNQQEITVHFFFGTVFACGLMVGILGMVPRWWQHRRVAMKAKKTNSIV